MATTAEEIGTEAEAVIGLVVAVHDDPEDPPATPPWRGRRTEGGPGLAPEAAKARK